MGLESSPQKTIIDMLSVLECVSGLGAINSPNQGLLLLLISSNSVGFLQYYNIFLSIDIASLARRKTESNRYSFFKNTPKYNSEITNFVFATSRPAFWCQRKMSSPLEWSWLSGVRLQYFLLSWLTPSSCRHIRSKPHLKLGCRFCCLFLLQFFSNDLKKRSAL